MDVEQDDGHGAVGELCTRLGERRRLAHAPALELEIDPAQEPDRGVVVDNENVLGGPLHRRAECMRLPGVPGCAFAPFTGEK